MAKYIVSYDTTKLNQTDRNAIYQKIEAALVEHGTKIQGSVWIIDVTNTSIQIRDFILDRLTITERRHLDVFVSELVKDNCAAQILDHKILTKVKTILPSCSMV